MERNCTQHKDFNEHVYQRLRDKYKDFRLPHTWTNVYQRNKQTNLTYMLRCGLETPNSQPSHTPRLFSPSWGKQKLIKSLSFRPSSMQSSPSISSPGNAMLSTQFNRNGRNTSSIPLFSNNIGISVNTELQNNTVVDAMFETDVFNDDSLLSSPSISNAIDHVNETPPTSASFNNEAQKSSFSRSLKEAFNKTIDTEKRLLKEIPSSVLQELKPPTKSPHEILKDVRMKTFTQSSSVQEPFKDFLCLSCKERSAVLSVLLSCDDVALALSYSDTTSHLGIGSSRQTHEKITVSGICFVFKEGDSNDNVGLFVPVSSSGENEDAVVQFLHAVLTSDIVKVSFNAYQLYIVCNILIKSRLKGDSNDSIRNIIDLKIASWLLMSDDVPQTLADLETRYLESPRLTSNQNFSSRLHTALVKILDIKQVVCKHLVNEKLLNLFNYLECPLLGTICQMGQTGICIDKRKLQLLSKYLAQRLSEIEQEASAVLGRPILLTSPVQLRQVLYDELKLDEKITDKVSRTAATREKSTSEACLLKMTDLHPLPRIILAHRRISKMKSTYIDGLRQYMKFDKLYPSWDQTAAATGRLAAFNPNVQAFPKGAIENRGVEEQSRLSVRDIVIPSPGCQFVAVDFCSIELRILAHFAKDGELMEMFKGSGDIFTTLTASWKNIPYENVTSVQRTGTKRVCYAIIYGVGIPKLSQILEITFTEAKVLMNSFLAKFQNISKFTNAVIKRARETKKLRTILNRLRHFPEINHDNFALRKSIERQAVNFVIQGSAADICKVSILKLSEYLRANTLVNARLLIQIHDELLYEVYHENVDQFSNAIFQILESPEFTREIHLSVPLKVRVEVGRSWGNMEEVPSH